MEPWIIYFIKVNVALMVLYAFYKCLFNTDTFFRLRRGMLLLICLAAFVYPFCEWTLNTDEASVAQAVTMLYNRLLPEVTIVADGQAHVDSIYTAIFSIKNSLLVLYFAGAGLLLFRTCLEIIRIRLSIRCNQQSTYKGIRFYTSSEINQPYSFLHWIFINPEGYTGNGLNEILIHEQTHVREHHSVDIMLAQLVIIICWFNPFAWLIRSEMRMNHEYLADKHVVNQGYDKKTYQYLLLGIVHNPLAAANLYNNFSVLPLKKRIKMLNRKQTRKIMLGKYVMFIPVVALLIFFSNCTNKPKVEEEQPTSATELAEKAPDAKTTEATKNANVATDAKDATVVPETTDTDSKLFDMVEEMPSYPGGMKDLLSYLAKNIKYPAIAQDKQIQGRVIVQFVVEKDGSISDVHTIRGIDSDLDKEAVRVIKAMPNWIPGKQGGKTVRVKFTVPVMFKLQ